MPDFLLGTWEESRSTFFPSSNAVSVSDAPSGLNVKGSTVLQGKGWIYVWNIAPRHLTCFMLLQRWLNEKTKWTSPLGFLTFAEAQESVPIANQKVDTSPPAAQQDDSEPATTVQEPQDEDNTDTDDTNIDDEDSKDGVSKSEHEWKVDKKALGEPFQRFHLNELRKYASQKSSFFVDFCQQRGGAVNCPDRRKCYSPSYSPPEIFPLPLAPDLPFLVLGVPTILKKKQLAVTKFGEAGLEGTAARTVIQKVEPLCKHEKRNYRPFNEEPAPKEWEGRTMSHRCSNCINRGNRNM
ncbi:hypothetical protein RvY_12225-1 [Ramazzottius varieornatus]|uniref:Uncharacterized protein n=1 Tax=Ramazzottius varieornatus TaxID=947166 RepID=A0A1D1VIS1_RAMVA|nr:hypothetical protein RvY_12225-1 [Ramazzottius varieornatus]